MSGHWPLVPVSFGRMGLARCTHEGPSLDQAAASNFFCVTKDSECAGERPCMLKPRDKAVGQNQWNHFGVDAPPMLVYFSRGWDVHWRYDLAFDPWPQNVADPQQ